MSRKEYNPHDDKRSGGRSEYRPPQKPQGQKREDRPYRDNRNHSDREISLEERMPKLKEQEAPNFAASNKYAFLETADDVSE